MHCLLDVHITVCTSPHLHSISYNVITILSNRSFYNQEGMYKLTHLPSSESLVKILPPRVSSLDFRSESLHFVIVQCKTWIHRLRGSLGGFSGDKKDLNHEEVAIISNLFI